ncbi:hypothetical protein [Halarchaeum salinum]|uniref:Uncharacterized protein n=1 Tax=Halarchaeum salinum TaxID=489912 RepID=A0AAV3S9R5_9EURY
MARYRVVCPCESVADATHYLRSGAELARDVHNGLCHFDEDRGAEVVAA